MLFKHYEELPLPISTFEELANIKVVGQPAQPWICNKVVLCSC